jgi:hypothetical protein
MPAPSNDARCGGMTDVPCGPSRLGRAGLGENLLLLLRAAGGISGLSGPLLAGPLSGLRGGSESPHYQRELSTDYRDLPHRKRRPSGGEQAPLTYGRLVEGCAMVVEYAITITVSVVSGSEAPGRPDARRDEHEGRPSDWTTPHDLERFRERSWPGSGPGAGGGADPDNGLGAIRRRGAPPGQPRWRRAFGPYPPLTQWMISRPALAHSCPLEALRCLGRGVALLS